MPRWEKREFNLSPAHRWQARKGNKIFVADRGAVQFEYPGDWVPSPGEHSFCFYDKPEPDDDIRLECSVIRMPPIKDDDLERPSTVGPAGEHGSWLRRERCNEDRK